MQNQITNNWQQVKIEDVSLTITRGIQPSYSETMGVVVVNQKCIRNGKISLEQARRNNIEKKPIPPEKLLRLFDVLINSTGTGTVGRVAQLIDMATPMTVDTHVTLVRPDLDKVDGRYLGYKLWSLEKFLENSAEGSTNQVELSRDSIKKIEFNSPTLPEQRQIASILLAFDCMIEVNNKIVKILEEIAQAIFKEWFIDFHFPGYDNVKFIESERGKIPENWEIRKIKDVVKINKGLSYSSDEIRDGNEGLPLINLGNFQRGGGFKTEGIKFYKGKYNKSHIVQPGDIVIALTDLTSNREVIGHPARVPGIGWENILISLDVCSLEGDELLKEFLYYLMLRKDFSFLMASSASGTNVSHLSKSVIEDYVFILPKKELIRIFHELISPIFLKVNKIVLENQKLAIARDLLLPKLMRGEVRV